MKKLIPIIIIGLLLTSCGTTNEPSNTNNSADSSKTIELQQNENGEVLTNKHGFELPKETIKIDYYYVSQIDPNIIAERTAIVDEYILENFNVDLNRISYDSDPNERLNLMLASGDYPGVISGISAENLQKWVAQGRVVEINEYMNLGHGTKIKDILGDKLNRYIDDGKLYGLPNGWGILPIPDVAASLRWDYYQEIGAPNFETPEEYYEVLKQMLEKYPTNKNGEKNYAMSWYTNNNSTADAGLIDYAMGVWGLQKGFKVDENNNLTHWINTEEGLDAAKFFNQIYIDGNFDPDGFVNDFNGYKEKSAQERILGFYGEWWRPLNAGHEVWQKNNPDWTEDMRMVQFPIKSASAEKAYLSAKDGFGWNYVIITDKCEDVEGTLKFLEWAMSDDGAKLLGWGVPNEEKSNWTIEEDGSWEWNQDMIEQLSAGTYDYDEHYLLGMTSHWIGLNQGLMEDGTTLWFDQNFNEQDKWKKMLNDNLKDTIYDATERRYVIPQDSPLIITKQQIDDIVVSGWANMVTSSSQEECEKIFYETQEKLSKAGMEDFENFLTENYKTNLENWN